MGTSASQHTDLANNEYVLRLVGTESVSPNDPFWNPLLSFTLKPPATSHDDMVLEERVRPICEVLASHNLQSVNFGSLLRVFFSRSAELLASAETDNSMFSWQTYNAMFIIRCYTKYLTRNFKEADVIRHIEAQGVSTGGDEEGSTLVRYVDALVGILVQVPVKDFTYALHCEAINSLLTLLSVQLITAEPAIHLQIFRAMLECSRSEAVTHALLKRYTEQAKPPPSPGGSILVGLATDLWSLLTLNSWGDTGAGEISPLADKALLLLLVLVNHCSAARVTNPYRDALAAFSESLSDIYVTLCGTLARGEEPATLLLYQLVHRNATFKTYLLSRADLERLILPVLHTVYGAPHSPSHHVYMALIVLLMLTEDPLFNRTVYATMVKGVPWYTERSIPEISLGGLLVLVTTRTAQYNLLKMRDKYLHTNCLAALANMSAQFSQLHPYVCQRIVGLFEVLSRTHARNNHESEVEEALRILLEVLNSCLTHQLIHNTNLVYTLLYKKHVFDPYRGHPAFHDIVSNIDQVIEYFTMKLERAGEQSVDVSEVLAQVQRYALQWRHDRLKKFPELKFKYVEEDKPEEFFIPYVWTLVSQRSGLYWNMELTKC